ncbi:MAG: hypothetical protein Q7K43_05325, partial [Candidatus Woesearchaeota archaeon]|nr:hypothetical protein [Candidatus Woesearchaeota archaeon]
MEIVNVVFNWITTKESYACRLNAPQTSPQGRVVVIGVVNYGRFDLVAGDYVSYDRPALGIAILQKLRDTFPMK